MTVQIKSKTRSAVTAAKTDVVASTIGLGVGIVGTIAATMCTIAFVRAAQNDNATISAIAIGFAFVVTALCAYGLATANAVLSLAEKKSASAK